MAASSISVIQPVRGRTQPSSPSLEGFEHVQRFHDPRLGKISSQILPGEHYVTFADELVTTVLGSCVAACVWDPVAGIGGMNHFMIPTADHRGDEGVATAADSGRYGVFAMELLVNTILKYGGERARLLVKLVGGGHVVSSGTPVGWANVTFARDYVANEGFRLVGEHVGGVHARRVVFHPLSGRSKVVEVSTSDPVGVSERERSYVAAMSRSTTGSVEIFEE
ncbi:MAG: chemoreceptor glutamine deamidase CheD [Actinomycetota bacterium]|jgi:chemotaxis protein CheD|nr:chemoreceptor glutamine deamidase CheD [Actinomycetota bacterium]